jgi:hypothetical protein
MLLKKENSKTFLIICLDLQPETADPKLRNAQHIHVSVT